MIVKAPFVAMHEDPPHHDIMRRWVQANGETLTCRRLTAIASKQAPRRYSMAMQA